MLDTDIPPAFLNMSLLQLQKDYPTEYALIIKRVNEELDVIATGLETLLSIPDRLAEMEQKCMEMNEILKEILKEVEEKRAGLSMGAASGSIAESGDELDSEKADGASAS